MAAAEIPVVDLADFPAERAKLRAACEGPGCFRVVGHGVAAALRAKMKHVVRQLLDLPDELKRCNGDVIAGSGYMRPSETNPLYEAFGLYDAASPADVDAFCDQLQASPHQRETIKSYASVLHGLALDIACKIAESFGACEHSFKGWACQFRLNKYSFTEEENVGSSGVQIHTDCSFLTVLQDDDCVGGLEIMDSRSKFVAVDPLPGTFLINLGDIAKLWSNGQLHNLKHRVLCKEAAIRISIALFLLGPKHEVVEPPAALVDSEHPRLYHPFTYEEYRKLRLSSKSHSGEAISLYAINSGRS